MKNTSSLLLTLVSYLITLATIVFLLFAAMPPSLKAQTNTEIMATNAATSNNTARVVVEPPQVPQPPPVRVDIPGVHIGDVSSQANAGEGFTGALALMIPIVAIVMGCSIPIVVVTVALYFRHRKNKMLHETVRAMVDKGVPIPPELFKTPGNDAMDDGQPNRPRKDLRTGLILTCIGIGIVLFIGRPGWIILFLGVAFLLIASFERKNKNDQQPPKT